MVKKILFSISIMVVFLFLIQPVASIFVGLEKSNPVDSSLLTETEPLIEPIVPEESPLASDKPGDIKAVQKEREGYLEKIKENYECIRADDPIVPMPDYEMDDIIVSEDELAGMSTAEYINRTKAKEIRFGLPETETQGTHTRAPAADLSIAQMEWEYKINSGWAHYSETPSASGTQPAYGGFMVGETTRITVTVTNHNPATPVSNIYMNFSVRDYYSGMYLIKSPQQVEFSIVGQTQDVTFDYTPEVACVLYLSAYISYNADTDKSNNGVGWYGARVLIWASDFEGSGFGDGSQTPNTWTGVPGLGGNNQWHKTNTASNQNSLDHTTQWSWYHGDESGGIDTYDDSLSLYLESPVINMQPGSLSISDGQEELGELRDNYYYIFAVPTWGGMFTGSAATGDVLYAYEYSDDGGDHWRSQYTPTEGSGIISGNWGTQDGSATPGWYPHSFPFARMLGDGQGGNRDSNGAKNWSTVQFRLHFEGDNDGITQNMPGYYADDFITWGYHHYITPYDVHLLRYTHMTQNVNGEDTPIIYPNIGVDAKFDTTIHTHGSALTNIPIKVDIKKGSNNINAPSVSGWPKTQQVASSSETEEATASWTWQPTEEGDYYVLIEAGDLSQDYVIGNNKDVFKVYVRNPNARVLVVDDDNSANGNGIFYLDTEWKMLNALDDLQISYNVYNVEWNKTGPTKIIMDNYEAVIWMTGLDNEYDNYGRNPSESWSTTGEPWAITLKPEDVTEISSFLNQGDKNIWIISPGLIYDKTNKKGGATPTGFLNEYMHITYCASNLTTYNLDGSINIRGTPDPLSGTDVSLARDAEYNTYFEEPEIYFSDRGGSLDVNSDAAFVFYQNNQHSAYNSLQTSENYNLVYFAFNYYLIDDPVDRADMVYRVMNFFGLEGGLDVELDDSESISKMVDFGETVSFKFKATNLGLMTETMQLKLDSPIPDNIPNGWNVKLNDKAASATLNEIIVPGSSASKVFYLNVTAPTSFTDSAGNKDTTIKNTTYGENEKPIQFKIRVESKNYPTKFFDFAGCFVRIGLTGYVELSVPVTSGTIDIVDTPEETTEFYVDYDIQLKNITNGKDNYDVKVEVDNPMAKVMMGTTEIGPNELVTLVPFQQQDLTVRVAVDEHEPMGDYYTTFTVKDVNGDVLNSTMLTTTVEQYYNIAISPVNNKIYSTVLDPNKMNSDFETITFEVTLENYGNGPDTIELEWEENYDSPSAIPSNWIDDLVEIFEESDMGDTIDEIEIPAYDKNSDEPGSVSLVIEVTIPKEEDEGTYWIDLLATSSAPPGYVNNLWREGYEYEDNFTFQVEMVLPEFSFEISKCKFLKEDGSNYLQGEDLFIEDSITIVTVLRNTGTATAEDVKVQCITSISNVPQNTQIENITIPRGKTVYLNWSIDFEDKGVHQFVVTIDPSQTFLGDYAGDNSWNQYIEVKEKDKEEEKKKTTIIDPGSSNLTLIVVIIVVVIILIVVLLFFFMRMKKNRDDEFDDIDSDDISPDEMAFGGAQLPGRMPPSRRPAAAEMQPSREQMAALAPQTQKQLPPSGGARAAGGIQVCASCKEKNPEDNKFCQTCGGKL